MIQCLCFVFCLSSLYVFTNSLTRFVVSFCHPRPPPVIPDPRLKMSRTSPDRGSRVWGGRSLFGKTREDTSPTGSWCLCVGAGLGARPSFLFSCGVSAPHDEVLLFRQKDPKPVAPGRGPPEGVPAPRSLVCGLRNSLRSDSPRRHMEGTGPGRSPARRRREAFLSCPALSCWHSCSLLLSSPTPPAVIPVLSCCHPRPRSGIQGFCLFPAFHSWQAEGPGFPRARE